MNENAHSWKSLECDLLGGRALRTHIRMDHKGYDVNPVHIPPQRDGVVI